MLKPRRYYLAILPTGLGMALMEYLAPAATAVRPGHIATGGPRTFRQALSKLTYSLTLRTPVRDRSGEPAAFCGRW